MFTSPRPFLATAVVALLSGLANAQTAVPAAHPLVGKWEWTRPSNNCTEVYDFRTDGTVPVRSGSEKTENVFTVAANPDQNGFYRQTIKTTKDYGGTDCANDETDSTGQESTIFVVFDPSKTTHLVCREPKVERCFGPLRRVRE